MMQCRFPENHPVDRSPRPVSPINPPDTTLSMCNLQITNPGTAAPASGLLPQAYNIPMFRRMLAAGLLCATLAFPAVKSVHVIDRTDVLSGKSFGKAGAYERITAKVHFAIDPKNPANRIVTDIDLAPRNEQGLVEFSSDLYVLKPRDPALGNGTVLYEVSNRGGKGMLGMFNRAAGSLDPHEERDFGDGFL